jgi:hypothetical protein
VTIEIPDLPTDFNTVLDGATVHLDECEVSRRIISHSMETKQIVVNFEDCVTSSAKLFLENHVTEPKINIFQK